MAPDYDDEAESSHPLHEVFRKNSRPWQGFWWWRDRAVMERNAVRTVLMGAGIEVSELRSRTDDPPDCEAMIDGRRCGIEVTELLHRPALERSIRAVRAREEGREPDPNAREAYFTWEREDVLEALQGLIDRKDQAETKGGPYSRYILVIVTDEFVLDQHTVAQFLDGATFNATYITDVLFGLSYHPSSEPGGGSYPVFTLHCVSREA
ncbi:MAG TPA: hypothetical protein VGU45_14310 [Microvirga sp.]|jgi:hypothetical protein|nr:hypothetical protein [Microvirga sp.]